MHAEHCRSGKRDVGIVWSTPKERENDVVNQNAVDGVQNDIEQVVTERIQTTQIEVQAICKDEQLPRSADKGKDIANAVDVDQSWIVRYELYVVENQSAIETVGVNDER